MIVIRSSKPDDGERVVEIWRDAVDATHHFLAPNDRMALDEMVCGFLPAAPLWLAVDANDRPIAFMLIDEGHMEALSSIPRFEDRALAQPWCAMGCRFNQL
jgi:putative acetyltransferase